MRATTVLQIIAFLAVGGAAAPIELVPTRTVGSPAVNPNDPASNVGLKAGDNSAAGAGAKLERRRYYCPNILCGKEFKTQAALDHHVAHTVHPANV
ncbi:hypothetical protein PpBr36_05359 [Pyricularia pennisetigena]|uniref:hypothetical protein n=1 Tax=Pyricularia pennisetigena TaxID=1578925 RepID=UPI00114D783F|nr:hypothetical protein PpBr36_05359 [Pyricularia pennisetigena]TLS27218.1 hypothetical protein PpBr36_05359 [Pyricularia pennisetigena]